MRMLKNDLGDFTFGQWTVDHVDWTLNLSTVYFWNAPKDLQDTHEVKHIALDNF